MTKFFFGAFGAILPDVILFESKKLTTSLTFDIHQYIIVTLLFMISAGVVATVIPDSVVAKLLPFEVPGQSAWNSILVGVALPVIISTVAAVGDRASRPSGEQLVLRGAPIAPAGAANVDIRVPGNVIDLLAIY